MMADEGRCISLTGFDRGDSPGFSNRGRGIHAGGGMATGEAFRRVDVATDDWRGLDVGIRIRGVIAHV